MTILKWSSPAGPTLAQEWRDGRYEAESCARLRRLLPFVPDGTWQAIEGTDLRRA